MRGDGLPYERDMLATTLALGVNIIEKWTQVKSM